MNYKSILKYGEDKIDIEKSRFIGYAMPVETEEEALEFIEKIGKKHYDATHNCYAYIIGLDGMVQRFNDDGEPSGTAGIPMLEVLKKEGLVNVVAVATRYFGGVKLGSGGLIRAYTRTCKIGIDAGIIVEETLNKIVKLRLDYTLYGAVENFLRVNGYQIKDTNYDDKVNIEIYVDKRDIEKFEKAITDLTSAEASIEMIGEEYIPIRNGKRLERP